MSVAIPHYTRHRLLSESSAGEEIWAVDLTTQTIHRFTANGHRESELVSTSRVGPGAEPDSNRTPCGWHRVTQVIGRGGPTNQEYISREPVPPSTRDDRILSRILWLDGMEPDLNATSHERFIYLHGTNQTESLGKPDSAGCIRMHPETIATWADQCGDHTPLVWIGQLE